MARPSNGERRQDFQPAPEILLGFPSTCAAARQTRKSKTEHTNTPNAPSSATAGHLQARLVRAFFLAQQAAQQACLDNKDGHQEGQGSIKTARHRRRKAWPFRPFVGYQHSKRALIIVFTKLYFPKSGFLYCYKKLPSIWLVSGSFFKRIAG